MPDSSAPQFDGVSPMPPASRDGALQASWQEGLTIVNLRGDPQDSGFRDAARRALGIALPDSHLRIATDRPDRGAFDPRLTVVPAGPDDWFVIGPPGGADALVLALREQLTGRHVAITDVSSGYLVLRLAGPQTRDVLAQGCPLDLHPRIFGAGQCAGSHFFKASVWIWRSGEASEFELLVRRSFVGYVRLMLAHATRECGLEECCEPEQIP